MATPAAIPETVEYRVVLVQRGSPTILAFGVLGRYCLPRVRIPQFTRPAQQLRTAIDATWGLDVLVLDILIRRNGDVPCVVAELLTPRKHLLFTEVGLDQILDSELCEAERSDLALLLEGKCQIPLSRIGWIDEVWAWIESVTSRKFSSNRVMDQLNAGVGFGLLRFRSADGFDYWFKATDQPNTHEFAITSRLSEFCSEFLPRLLATKRDWNAWLTEDAGRPLTDASEAEVLLCSAGRLASLQLKTIDCVDALSADGAFDQRLVVLRSRVDPIFDYLIGAMGRQTSTRVAPLGRARLLEIGQILMDTILQMEGIGIPDTLLHNDLSQGNILYDGTRCVFTDWSEAAIGNPFLSLERLCLLRPHISSRLQAVYREIWSEALSEASIEEAFALMPLIAIFAYLYGRGDWIRETRNITPQFESYARSLARHMDRAAHNRVLLEKLCR